MSDPISRRDAIRVATRALAGAVAWKASGGQTGAAAPRPPNIIFILADDLGYGDLGCYGQRMIQTPCLDRMAAEGIRFTDFYAGSTVCAPSRGSLMTGLHTGHAYVRGNAVCNLRPEDVTVAQLLKSAGYATGLVGKWALGVPGGTSVPNAKGFDEWFGYMTNGDAHNYYPEFLWRDAQKVPLRGNASGLRTQYSNDLFTAEALDFVRRKRSGPFYLQLCYTVPHANNERGNATGNGMEVPSEGVYAGRAWPACERGKAAMISRMDSDIGQLLAELKRQGIDDSTIVFFTSDNGPHKEGGVDPDFLGSRGPLRGIKRDLYEGGIRVPMIARWPGQIVAGRECSTPFAFWDFLPTACALAGAPARVLTDGISFVPTLQGQEQSADRPLYWEFYERGYSQAARLGQWKAVRNAPDKPIEVYDLAGDPGETKDLASDRTDIAQTMDRVLQECHSAPAGPVNPPPRQP
jgi:arylsulfatase A-like enzyme